MTVLPGRAVEAVLCDADGCLFPSEEPAYAASADVTNALLRELGVTRTYTGEELRTAWTGLNFRSTAARLAAIHEVGLTAPELEHWVAREKDAVTQHLARTLRPDAQVHASLRLLAERHPLAVVSSSAAARIDACLSVCELEGLFPEHRRFSAEDSLDPPASKPNPAIYVHAVEQLGLQPEQAVAIEDSVVGVRAAVGAGVPVVGLVQFVPSSERQDRERELWEAGAFAVVPSWDAVVRSVSPTGASLRPV